MRRLLLAGLVVLAGCDIDNIPRAVPQTNAQIIAATKQCESAGMRAVTLKNVYDEILRVQCEPKP